MAVLRGAVASATVVIAASALAVAVLSPANYAAIISLYESVHAGVLGGIALTIGQLAVLPNLVIWRAPWFIGPGFANGAGSSVTPLGTTLGPIPAIPPSSVRSVRPPHSHRNLPTNRGRKILLRHDGRVCRART